MSTNAINWARRVTTWFALWIGVWAIAAPLPALAAESGERAATQAIIEAQLAAFSQDESAKAFSYASPDIQRVFENAENFMQMVKSNYRVVYRHTQVKFLTFQGNELFAQHTVQMVDENNSLWTVLYTLEKVKDGSWRISSCQTSKAQGDLI
ncbi:MAG: DUF4864 domain-containing protein [Limnobacter sp.]|nr:DUF4864 domain-containing protein [Limnobacter sp.]